MQQVTKDGVLYESIYMKWKELEIHRNKIRNCQRSRGETLECPLTDISQPESLFTWLKQ